MKIVKEGNIIEVRRNKRKGPKFKIMESEFNDLHPCNYCCFFNNHPIICLNGVKGELTPCERFGLGGRSYFTPEDRNRLKNRRKDPRMLDVLFLAIKRYYWGLKSLYMRLTRERID